MSDDGIPYEIYDWHADYSDWNVGSTFDATPVKVTEPDRGNAVWYKHPKAHCKVSTPIMTTTRSGTRITAMLVAAMVTLVAFAPIALACGRDTDCPIGKRTYRIAFPDGQSDARPTGAIIFVHGYRGNAKDVMRNKALVAVATDLGLALIAAEAAGVEWNLPGIPSVDATSGIDELAYFDALLADAIKRFGIDPTRVTVSGFSSGAMMVWYLACYRGTSFAGFVPMSGTFWKPIPLACPTGSVNLIHYHGTEDPIVPLEGRQIKDGHQGDVLKAFDLLARSGNFGPIKTEQHAELKCSRRFSSDHRFIELCLFPGYHHLVPKYLSRAWQEIVSQKTGP